MNTRRELVLALMAGALAAPIASFAQPVAKIARIGFLFPASQQLSDVQLQAFRDGLRELGYAEGKNYQLELRWADGKLERLPPLAAELIEAKVRSMEVRDTRKLDVAFEAISREHPEALLILVDPFSRSQRSRIVEFAAGQRIPAIYESSEFVDVGGLASYGPTL